jgi:choline dehydrogenase-like flavoprotein
LLHSGIKGRAVGHYLTDHAGISANGIMSRERFPEVLGTLNVLLPDSDDKPYQVEIQRFDKYYFYKYISEPLLKDLPAFILGSCKLESRFENYLALDPHNKDEYGVPKLKVRFSYSEKDKQAIQQTIEGVKHISDVVGVSLTPVGGRPAICLLAPGRERHSSGTCRIGSDPLTAAADPYGEIFGVSGLFVADNSMIPSMSAANPTLTTVALSIRTADQIIRQFQS